MQKYLQPNLIRRLPIVGIWQFTAAEFDIPFAFCAADLYFPSILVYCTTDFICIISDSARQAFQISSFVKFYFVHCDRVKN
eukprot:scaffold2148_cov264-Chaetoceros_neogracile.AAC.26